MFALIQGFIVLYMSSSLILFQCFLTDKFQRSMIRLALAKISFLGDVVVVLHIHLQIITLLSIISNSYQKQKNLTKFEQKF